METSSSVQSPARTTTPQTLFRQVGTLQFFGLVKKHYSTKLQLLDSVKTHFHYFDFYCNDRQIVTPIALIQFVLKYFDTAVMEKVLLLCSHQCVAELQRWLSRQTEYVMFPTFELIGKPVITIKAHFLSQHVVIRASFQSENCLEKRQLYVTLIVDLLNSEPFVLKVSDEAS